MNTDTFDRLTRLFDRGATRRAAFAALLGATVLGAAFSSTAAKRESLGYGKTKSKNARRSKSNGNRHRRVNAQAKNKPGNHCISPSGTDLNLALGISAQIVAPTPPFLSGCDKVGSGEQWTVAGQVWTMAQTFEEVPGGFVPAGDTPLADFLAKFEAVKYVIDRGTKQEKTVAFPNSNALVLADPDEGLDIVTATTLGTLKPLPVGKHVVESYWVFRAMHCDGIVANVDENCLPAGETLFIRVRFEVVPGHN